ncbi:MAG: methyltransferase, TrmH family [Acidobacteriota bacterium]|nr:methyltransferase, TrmH family [Acidobacteriota bacterium]
MINSRQNSLARRARAVRERDVEGLIFVEGLRLCEEAARSRLYVEDILFTEKFASDERGARLLEELRRVGARAAEVSEDVLDFVADTKTPQGIVLLANGPACDAVTFESSLTREPLVVVMHGINNAANAGAMLRVAEAAGAAGVVATQGTADLLSPKALRSAMGSAFRLPIWSGASFHEVIEWCHVREIETVSTDLDAKQSHTEHDWHGAHAIICGAEAGGLASEEIAQTNARVRIPMREPVESLNVAVALGVVLYEAARQRGFA